MDEFLKENTRSVKTSRKEISIEVTQNPVLIENFKKYAKLLDGQNDKYERLVKLSRDITIESKRIIFLLHNCDRIGKMNLVLEEAEKRLGSLVSNHWKLVAKELDNEDPYQYRRAFSPGLQEFIEAFTFFNYLKMGKIFHWNHYQSKLEYEVEGNLEHEKNQKGHESTEREKEIQTTAEKTDKSSQEVEEKSEKDKKEKIEENKKIFTTIAPNDYFLGVADVTGELMRRCINCLGCGKPEEISAMCQFVRDLYTGFLSVNLRGTRNRELSRKMFTLQQNLLKMEMACYNIQISGIESAKMIMADPYLSKTYVYDETESNEP